MKALAKGVCVTLLALALLVAVPVAYSKLGRRKTVLALLWLALDRGFSFMAGGLHSTMP